MTIVRFPPEAAEAENTGPLTVDQARDRFGTNAHTYLDVPGLLWKAYLLSDDGLTVGGTYWWSDRASAEAKFNAGWLAGVTKKYGAAPTVEWFEAPVVVDARFNIVRIDPPPAKIGLDAPTSESTGTEPAGSDETD